jgi:hypothetical protein
MSENNPVDIKNPLIKRNHALFNKYLTNTLDEFLIFLRSEYIRENSDSSFIEFTSINYFDFIMKDYIRKKGVSQIQRVLDSAVLCLDHIKGSVIEPTFLDQIVQNTYKEYANVDFSLKHTATSHPIRSELELLSQLTYRIAIIQCAEILKCNNENINFISELFKETYPTKKEFQKALKALFSMGDQMVDCFERNLDAITIPFYKPTWKIRDFKYMRRIYEYAIQLSEEEIIKI